MKLLREDGRFASDAWAAEDAAAEQRLETRLTAALATMPAVQLPEGFAARIAAQLGPAAAAPAHYGRRVLWMCGALLAGILLVLMVAAPVQQPRWLLSLLSVELALLSLGAGPWRRALRWPA